MGAMVEAHPEIVELDCNPLIAVPEGAMIVDARVRVEAAPPPAPIASLRPSRRCRSSPRVAENYGGALVRWPRLHGHGAARSFGV